MKFIAAVQQASQSQRCVTLNANQQNRFWCVRYLVFVSFSRYMDVVFILQLCNSLLHMLDARFSVCYEGKNAVCFVLLLVMQSILIYSQLVLRSDLNWYTYNFDSVKKVRRHTHLDDTTYTLIYLCTQNIIISCNRSLNLSKVVCRNSITLW